MSQPFRTGGATLVDLGDRLAFRFNGRSLQGVRGDTLASALLANGVHLVGRSWKYHRPRGILSAGVEEPNALVQLERDARSIPNARATEIELYPDLDAASVNCFPGPERDWMAIAGLAAGMLPAGFYYKTFKWPGRWWPAYERWIRRAAGLGRAPQAADPDTYERLHAHCDVLVVGGGPAGLAAALAAARRGARVILADERARLGGSLHAARQAIEGAPAPQWLARTVAELARSPQVTLLERSTVFGYHDYNLLTVAQRCTDHLAALARGGGPRERLWKVQARQVVLATGAHERPLVFRNNDRPGVMLAQAVSTYLHGYGVRCGSRAVVFTNNDSAYQTALDLHAAGVTVAAVVDARPRGAGAIGDAVRAQRIEVIAGAVVVDADGSLRLSGVHVAPYDGHAVQGAARALACDLLAVSGGFSPVVHLHAQSGGRPRWDETACCFRPGPVVQAERSAGACGGPVTLREALQQGWRAGHEAASAAGMAAAPEGTAPGAQPDAAREEPLAALWQVPSPAQGAKAFVDFQNDVTAADIALATREGYSSIELVKRYTAVGFGTDQGKLGNVNAMAIAAAASGRSIAETGTTTYRPNYTPVSFGAIAGRETGPLFDAERKTAMHEWHVAHGAAFENVGQWKRAWYYPRHGESMQQAVQRECRAVRQAVGIMDVSTLGKIDAQGPDAAVFLDWFYTGSWQDLKVGRCRLGLMCDENGMVMDDGVGVRLGERHFLLTTTTGGAARVLGWMERWRQTEWPQLRVHLTSVTDQWAAIALAGPLSRQVLQAAGTDIDCSREAFPFLHLRSGAVAGVPARVMRVSFSGELCYEIYVPADHGRAVWEALVQAGAPLGITPYGTETMHVLRAEKGYIIVGQDTDGSVTPIDLGMERFVSRTKDFLGRRSLARSDTSRADRKQLVGLLADDPVRLLPEGGQIVQAPGAAPPVPMEGHVTSSYASATLGRSIALALVKSGRSRLGQTVFVTVGDGSLAPARITEPVFYDPQGARQRV
ncbi:MAG TPA: sarcosine oxidase subunit alpha family protein [Burkholderiaceae bacterium]|nr:sarcosine oxidase subunit alpha family protein [Burkholderiaceae bacterium]